MKTKQVLLSLFIILFAASFSMAQTSANRLEASISGKTTGKVTPSELIAKQIVLNEANASVQSYTVVITNGGSETTLNVKGDMVTKEVSNLIRELPGGADVKFTNIKTNARGQNAPDLRFIIVHN